MRDDGKIELTFKFNQSLIPIFHFYRWQQHATVVVVTSRK